MDQTGRLYSLDNLRAAMMWLGIVLHVSVNHMTAPTFMAWKDRELTPAADLIFLFIHVFRMPVFFILAGFFVALLVTSRGYEGMLRHRFRRLAVPFAVFWPVLFVATIALIVVYVHVMVRGTLGFDPALMPATPRGRATIGTMHLWFIYYLLWFCLITAAIGSVRDRIPPKIKSGMEQVWQALGSRWWGFIVLAAPLGYIGSFYPGGLAAPDNSFIPHVAELVYSGMFFVFGWYLYGSRKFLLPLYAKSWWKYAAAGAVTFFVSLVLFGILNKGARTVPHIELYIAFAYNFTSWLWSFALLGVFIRYLPKQNAVLQYVSESSYWVYLVHMLGTIGFGALIYNLPIGALGKMGLNVFLTTVACLATYQVFVRNTPIGVFLNGRRDTVKAGASGAVA